MKYSTSLKPPLIVMALLCLLASGLALGRADKVNSTIGNETNNNISIDDEAYDIGLDAYLYFYPLVTMDISRRM